MTNSDTYLEQWLFGEFSQLCSVGVPNEVISREFNRIAIEYSALSRYYHTLDHIFDTFYWLDLQLRSRHEGNEELYFAALYHDIIYDAEAAKGVNEAASAKYAYLSLVGILGYPESFAGAVADLIMVTVNHTPTNFKEGLLSNADLGILQDSTNPYETYKRNIRLEYSAYNPYAYAAGRIKFLQSMLDRPQIFYTCPPPCVPLNETLARINIQSEIDSLMSTEGLVQA